MIKKEKQHNTQSKAPLYSYLVIGPMPFPWKAFKRHLNEQQKGVQENCKVKLFFIDGGLTHFSKIEKEAPYLISSALTVGDGDSSKVPMMLKKMDQNLSDLAFFLTHMLSNTEAGSLYFLGFLGGKLDHELFNLGEISRFLENYSGKMAPKISLDDKIEFLDRGAHLMEINGRFSLASFNENEIRISGDCQYKVQEWTKLPVLSSLGLSNQGFGLVKIETKNPLAIIMEP